VFVQLTVVHSFVAKGLDALDWQNLFGLSKILDKICLCQIFNLLNVGALRHSKIFVNHKCQSHRNKHHRFARCSWERLHEISGVMALSLQYVTVIFTASIECVDFSPANTAASHSLRYYVSHVWEAAVIAGYIIIASVLVFFSSLYSFNFSRSSCYFYCASGGFTFFDCNVLVLEIIIIFCGLRTEILRLKIEIKFSWLTFSFKSCRFQAWQKFVLLRGRTTASLKFGKLWQNLVDLKITGRPCLRQLVTNCFAR